jgi:membrane-associated phospholipid phosphatase
MKNPPSIDSDAVEAPTEQNASTSVKSTPETSVPIAPGRRRFLGKVGQASAAVIAAGVAGQSTAAQNRKSCDDIDFPLGVEQTDRAANRYAKAYRCRLDAAVMSRNRPLVYQNPNGDDARYENKIGSYSKALPHNDLGEVNLDAYETLVRARTSRNPNDFEAIQLGLGRKLTSPQAGLAMDLEGADSHHLMLPPAPRFDSAEEAGEMVELYWMALLRDVNYSDYATHPLAAQAAAELSSLTDFRGPKVNGQVTPATLFRNSTPGDLNGPYLSQFLLQEFSFGANPFSQKIKTALPGIDYMTNYQDWLAIQNGFDPDINSIVQFDPTLRYMRNFRDMARWVQVDALYQGYLQACLILLGQGARLDPGLPLYDTKVQAGFAQCGGPHILSLVTEVATRALKAVWYQKWFVHHRLRPEEFGGRVHNHLTGRAEYPIHPDVLNSQAVQKVFEKYGTYLLPEAFPEGSPTHTSYGSGHATVAGACVTALKAFFDETDIVKNPVVPNADGSALVPYEGPPLTVGGELNKVASNVANSRNGAGVHWRTDAVNSLALGEEVTICILEEQKLTYNDNVQMTLTKFDGTTITI